MTIGIPSQRTIVLAIGLLLQLNSLINAFRVLPQLTYSYQSSQPRYPSQTTKRKAKRTPLVLFDGCGVAETYCWKEDATEIEVSVKVPREIRARDLIFTPSLRSLDLRTKGGSILLDGERPLRGCVNLDGTFWVVEEPVPGELHRLVTVTIEKLGKTPKNDFEVVDFDWRGVFVNDTAEVIDREYNELEPLDVKEYAASMGVDVDNLDMSLVDKSMFSVTKGVSGANLTERCLDELYKSGLIQDSTRQADDTKYTTGNPDPASSSIPFLPVDIPSPCQQKGSTAAVPSSVSKNGFVQHDRVYSRASFAAEKAKHRVEGKENPYAKHSDPVEALTVKKLKEILKSQGLNTTGTKVDLQDRLRGRLNVLLQGQL